MSRGVGLGTAAMTALAVLAPVQSEAALSIHPAYVELELNRGRPSEVITVTNLTDQEARYRAQILHFLYTEEGSVRQVPPDEHSLAEWTKLNPREFTLPPNGSRKIRLSIIPPKNLAPGEYWAAIEFEPLQGTITEAEDAEGRKVRLQVISSILVPIVGQVGDLRYDFDLKNLEAWKTESGIEIVAHLVNTGNARVALKGTYEILEASGGVLTDGPIGDDTVLYGGERIFARLVEGNFPGSGYVVRVRYESRNIEEPIGGQTRVALKRPGQESMGPP